MKFEQTQARFASWALYKKEKILRSNSETWRAVRVARPATVLPGEETVLPGKGACEFSKRHVTERDTNLLKESQNPSFFFVLVRLLSRSLTSVWFEEFEEGGVGKWKVGGSPS